uniref:Uncharacterized protein n=1 Tax=Sphaerodactylus townsendi TaxID=933632 RepID=A0ACB8E7N1_9SAUR
MFSDSEYAEELGSENCKSPIFEEDTPSVMEIEMEELDKWMNSLKKNAECEYLTPVKEEKDLNAKTRMEFHKSVSPTWVSLHKVRVA